jgi:phosphoribosylaminoimidazole-succinocarboxamide synthase
MNTLAEWTQVYSGKVRELYIPIEASTLSEATRLLIVATDRVSAFDHILDPEIPGKGVILTQLSHWWFERLKDIPNHLTGEAPPVEVADRAMVVVPLDMFPIECVVRGYLAGSGWKEYQKTGSVCGVELPAGLSEGDRLPEPLFTPATKAAVGDHDENISFSQMVDIVGLETAADLRDLSLQIYGRAHDLALKSGVILADTKLEFGADPVTGVITLGDEVLTSDSSRYWDGELYAKGGMSRLDSFDKQVIRNWLQEHWDGSGTPPALPQELVDHTMDRYRELYTRLTGSTAPGLS